LVLEFIKKLLILFFDSLGLVVFGYLVIGEHFDAFIGTFFLLLHLYFDLIFVVSESATGFEGLFDFGILIKHIQAIIL
jgi:hypothetical protein